MSSAPSTVVDAVDRRVLPESLIEVCARSGRAAPSLQQPLRVAVFGCGDGATVAHIAASYPHLQVWAWDPVVEHVELTRRRCEREGLTNVHVHERGSVPAHLDQSVDIVVVHDLLVTVAPDVGQQLLRTVGSSLRPGGLVAVAYRTAIGWGSIVPVVTLFRHVVGRYAGDRSAGIGRGLELLQQLLQHDADYVAARPEVQQWIRGLGATPRHVIAAEYLQAQFRPMSHAQVVAELDAIGCVFLDRVADGEPELSASLAGLVDAQTSRVLAETYTDLAVRRAHRVDVFRLGDVTMEML